MFYIIQKARPFNGRLITRSNGAIVEWSDLSLADYLAANPAYEAISSSKFDALYNDYLQRTYLTKLPRAISEADYWDALEVLPPLRFRNHDGGQSFLMSEYTEGSITTQYIKLGNKYFCRFVDTTDKASLDNFDNLAGV